MISIGTCLKKYRRQAAAVLSAIMAFGLFGNIPGACADPVEPEQETVTQIEYVDANGVAQTPITEYTLVDEMTTPQFYDGWYVVVGNVTFDEKGFIFARNNCNLILCDGASLTITKGIRLDKENGISWAYIHKLTVWGQENGTGELNVTNPDEESAGIGCDSNRGFGTLVVNGGTLNINGGGRAAGIGTSYQPITNTVNVTINGGTVNTRGGEYGAGIGGGQGDTGGTITITGGTVNATGGRAGAGIGGGSSGRGGTVRITGGKVRARAGAGAFGIGAGMGASSVGNINIGFNDLSDYIDVDTYGGTVTLLNDFTDGTTVYKAGSVSASALNYKTLRPERFTGHSLTLAGDIGVNFFVHLEEEELEKATVRFTRNVEGKEKVSKVTFVGAEATENGYKATCFIPPAEMTCAITAQLLIDGTAVASDTYSAKQYGEYILTEQYESVYTGTDKQSYENLSNLVKAMLDYGAKCQLRFNRNTENLANSILTAEDAESRYYYNPAAVTADDIMGYNNDMDYYLENFGLSFSGASVVYLSKTSLRLYYTITDEEKFNAVTYITFNKIPVTYTEKDGMIYFELKDIAASELDKGNQIRFENYSYQYSVLDYAKACLKSADTSEEMKNLAAATFLYNEAADRFF